MVKRPCVTSETASFETAKFDPSDWSASWITDHKDKEFEPAPLFRKSFPVGKEVKDARVYVASAGYHELFINGERVGTNYLDPGYTHFDKRILYVTHDVTSFAEARRQTPWPLFWETAGTMSSPWRSGISMRHAGGIVPACYVSYVLPIRMVRRR